MRDQECVEFLRWALPRMGLRWPGFRKVRGQVCKRIGRRLDDLGLADLEDYRELLDVEESEWQRLDGFCRITISRFHRDRTFFELLAQQMLPTLAQELVRPRRGELRMWSAGCGAGEEPYTLAMIARLASAPALGRVKPVILATDTNPHQLERAVDAVYPASTLAELPLRWREAAFETLGDGTFRLRAPFRQAVRFEEQDLRRRSPGGTFELVLCRNLAFTYFSEEVQVAVLRRIREALVPGGLLGIGAHESLEVANSPQPDEPPEFEPCPEGRGLYRKI